MKELREGRLTVRLLIIDDDEEYRNVIRDYLLTRAKLESLSLMVAATGTLKRARLVLTRDQISLIIIDHDLGDNSPSGDNFVKELKDERLMIGWSGSDEGVEAFKCLLPADSVLKKPVRPATLWEVIQKKLA